MIIEGKKIAEEMMKECARECASLPVPRFLAVFFVGDNPASESFLKQKEKAARKVGVAFKLIRVPERVSEDELCGKIHVVAEDAQCGGIIIQLPLPSHLDRKKIIGAIPPGQDVDALRGDSSVLPPAVGVVSAVIKEQGFTIKDSTVAVVGAGFLVGTPIASWLKGKAKRLFIFDKGDDASGLADADIVITGVGSAGVVTGSIVKEGALVIDFGYSRGADGTLHGDFDPSGTEGRGIHYTPTPGGTGPILVAQIFENFYLLNKGK